MFLEDVVCANVQSLFPVTSVKSAHVFRVIRDTDMIQEDEADDLLETVDQGLRRLRHGAPSLLQVRLGFGHWLELTRLQRPDLKDPVFVPRTVWGPNDVDEVTNESNGWCQSHRPRHLLLDGRWKMVDGRR